MTEYPSLPIAETPYVTSLARAYISGRSAGISMPPPPTADALIGKAKNRTYGTGNRQKLVQIIRDQYICSEITLEPGHPVHKNLEGLLEEGTYTLTTGQQIHIFGGPLFFTGKIHSLLRQTRSFNALNSGYRGVPVFWMASEDHDLAEINHVKLYGETYTWSAEPGKAVGRITCDGLPELIDILEERADKTPENNRFYAQLRRHYLPGRTLAHATRSLLHEWFGDTGLIILDPDDPGLKAMWIDVAIREIRGKVLYETVSNENELLRRSGYEPRVNPREINYFWLDENGRSRLKLVDGTIIHEGNHKAISMDDLEAKPSQLSPNVIARPVYQETILPNILYLGGSAEIEYWLPLQNAFERLGIPYPVLAQRDSVIYIPEKQLKQIEQAGFEWPAMFLGEQELSDRYAEKSNAQSTDSRKEWKEMQEILTGMKRRYEERQEVPGKILKEIHDLQKGLDRLMNHMLDDDLARQKNDAAFSRLLKVRSRYFDRKPEREDFLPGFLQVLRGEWSRVPGFDPLLFLVPIP